MTFLFCGENSITDKRMMKQTAGKIYTDLQEKKMDKVSVFELQEAINENYIPELCSLIEMDKKKIDGDLFVEVIVIRDPLMPLMFKRYMKSRYTCPTPNYDQAVFHYSRKDDKIEYLWHIPDLRECNLLISESPLILADDEKQLLKHVLDFRDGTLLRLAKKLNNETNDYELTFSLKE